MKPVNYLALEAEDGLLDCFGLTAAGQVVYFDAGGSPYRAGLAGNALLLGAPLNLPGGPVQVITPLLAARLLAGQAAVRPARRRKRVRWPALLALVSAGLGLAALLGTRTARTEAQEIEPPRPPLAVKAVTGYNPLGPASIGPEVFEAFLDELKSPARPEAGRLYRACLELGCDPALALAFFEHESGGGRYGVAAQTRSWGNIRCSPGYECLTTPGNGAFRRYPDWTAGLRDWAGLLHFYRSEWRRSSLEEIIPKYAPRADNNNEAAYIAAVKRRVDDLRRR